MLAEDLRRFLSGEPIRARPVSLWGRSVKWAKCRPALAALWAVIALACVGAGVGITWHNLQVSEQRQEVLESMLDSLRAMDALCTRVLENESPATRAPSGGAVLAGQGARALRDLQPAARQQPRAAAANGPVHRAIGVFHFHLGKLTEAQAAYRRAIEISRELVKEEGAAEHRQELAASCQRLGAALLLTSHLAEAEEALREADLLYYALASEFPEEPKHRHRLAELRYSLAELFTAKGQMEEAEKAYRQAADAANRLAQEFVQVAAYRQSQASSLQGLGTLLMQRRNSRKHSPPMSRAWTWAGNC